MTFVQEKPGLSEDEHPVWEGSELPRTPPTLMPANNTSHRRPVDGINIYVRPENSVYDARELPAHSKEPAWPLKSMAEAKLLRHYIQKLAIWVTTSLNSLG